MVETLYNEEISEYAAKLREKSEAFFGQAGKEDLEIYRIENFEPIKVGKEFHGKFYMGDSYVIVKIYEKKAYDIHFWHGNEATSDEMGSSAALAVQLSERLPMASRHHLELQNEEGDLFQKYFKHGITYMKGGVASGFKHSVPEVHEPVMYQVKGTRYPRCFPVDIKCSSLNQGDVFLLDLGDTLYYWAGAEANQQEKIKALEVAVSIKNDERLFKCKLFYPEDDPNAAATFWEKLGGKGAIAAAHPDQGEGVSEADQMAHKLLHITDASGQMEINEVNQTPLIREMLSGDDSYILALFDIIYVWQGKHATTNEKRDAMGIAKKYIKDNNLNPKLRISRVPEGLEDARFKSFFRDWYKLAAKDVGEDKSVHDNQDIAALAQQQSKAKDMVLDKLGSSYTKSLYLLGGNLSEPQLLGEGENIPKVLFQDSVYCLDLNSSQHRYQICWAGKRLAGVNVARASEGMNAICGGELSSHMHRVNVKKGNEDETFLHFFGNHLVLADDAHTDSQTWLAGLKEKGAMFRIQSPFGAGAKAVQQDDVTAANLNSQDAFIVCTPGGENLYLWKGKGSSQQEAALGEHFVEQLREHAGNVQVFNEGEADDGFWNALGGKQDYLSASALGMPVDFQPRLFNVSNRGGYMFVKEVFGFMQEDLDNNDVMILDAYNTVYIWIGNQSNKHEQEQAQDRAEKYINSIQDGRNTDNVQITEVKAGYEPPSFQVQFLIWEDEVANAWLTTDPLAIMKAKEVEKQEAQKVAEEKKAHDAANPFEGFLDPNTNIFAYDDLKGKFPKGIKGNMKEYYLSDEEFEKVLGMNKDAWGKLKGWKQEEKKKAAGLF